MLLLLYLLVRFQTWHIGCGVRVLTACTTISGFCQNTPNHAEQPTLIGQEAPEPSQDMMEVNTGQPTGNCASLFQSTAIVVAIVGSVSIWHPEAY